MAVGRTMSSYSPTRLTDGRFFTILLTSCWDPTRQVNGFQQPEDLIEWLTRETTGHILGVPVVPGILIWSCIHCWIKVERNEWIVQQWMLQIYFLTQPVISPTGVWNRLGERNGWLVPWHTRFNLISWSRPNPSILRTYFSLSLEAAIISLFYTIHLMIIIADERIYKYLNFYHFFVIFRNSGTSRNSTSQIQFYHH